MYFQKKEGHLDNKWMVGRVEQIVRGRDGKVRKVIIRYTNASEEIPRFTERSVRKLVKLFSINEFQVQDDLCELQKRIDKMQEVPIQSMDDSSSVGAEIVGEDPSGDTVLGEDRGLDDVPAGNTRGRRNRCNCCCTSHCHLSFHTMGPTCQAFFGKNIVPQMFQLGSFPVEMMSDREDEIRMFGEDGDHVKILGEEEDSLVTVLQSLNLVM